MTAQDAIRGFRLLNECRELGADPAAWRRHFFNGLRELVDAQVVIGGEMRGFDDPDHRFEAMGIHRVGWKSEAAERSWAEYAESTPVQRTPEFPRLRNFKGDMVTLQRDDIWHDNDWYRSKTFNNIHRVCGIDDYVISIRRVPRLGHFTSLFLHRSIDAPAFSRICKVAAWPLEAAHIRAVPPVPLCTSILALFVVCWRRSWTMST